MTTPTAPAGMTGTASDLGTALDNARADGSLDFSDLAGALAELDEQIPDGTRIDGQEAETPPTDPSAAAVTDADGSPLPKAGDPTDVTAPATPDATDPPAAAAATDTPAPDATPDPLASATALTYTVDGETRTFDGILEVAGEGAIIPAEHLNAVRDRLQLADKREADNRALYAQVQSFEQAGGLAHLHKLATDNAGLNALVLKLGDALDNLDQFLVPNGQGGVQVDPRVRDVFYRELLLTAKEARAKAETERGAAARDAEAARASAASEAAEAETGVTAAVDSLVEAFKLTPEDRAEALENFRPLASALLKRMTPDLAAQHPGFKAGDKYVDRAMMVAWFRGRQAANEKAAKAEAAAKAAAAENAKRLAAPPVAPKAVQTPNRPNAKGGEAKAESWEDIKRAWRRGSTITQDE